MRDTSTTGNYYTINSIVMISGLTDRTIRSYISSGILEGEKINGLWHFTPEQVEAFLRHPTVRPSILAKNNGMVYDFLLEDKKQKQETCIMLDLPGADEKAVAEFFCYAINNGDYRDLQFRFDSVSGTPRIILRGIPDQVLALVSAYYSQ